MGLEPLRSKGTMGFKARLQGIETRAKEPRLALIAIISSFIAYEQRQFGTEGEYSGGWAPLAQSTLAVRAAKGVLGSDHILQATGRLKASLTTTSSPDSATEIIAGRELRLGTKVSYAVFHQKGTGKMPARPPVAIPPEARLRWKQILQRFVVHGEVEV